VRGAAYTDGVGVHLRGCAGFWLYALAGGMIAFSAIAAASIGLLTAVPAVIALVVASRLGRGPGEPLGLVSGAGLPCLAVAAIHAVEREANAPDPVRWAVAGVVLVAAGMVAYALVRPGSGRV